MTIITEQNVAFNYSTFFSFHLESSLMHEHTCINCKYWYKTQSVWTPTQCLVSSPLSVPTVTDGVSDNFITASPGLEPGATEPESRQLSHTQNREQNVSTSILFALIIAWQFIFLQILALYLSNIHQILLLTLQGFCGYFIHFPKSTDIDWLFVWT